MNKLFSPGIRLGFAALLCSPILPLSFQADAAVINHFYDRSAPATSINMCRTGSSGESLADSVPASPGVTCLPEAVNGDIAVSIFWTDGSVGTAVWAPNAGIGVPGVTVTSGTGDSALLWETGDTFSQPWTLSNFAIDGIRMVMLTAQGAPDMGFDTDDGSNPTHGAGGFPLVLDVTSAWNGTLDVVYSLWNNWNATTDMFHRMTLTFVDPVVTGHDFVFQQDTDEIPLPPSVLLLLPGVVGLAWGRRALGRTER